MARIPTPTASGLAAVLAAPALAAAISTDAAATGSDTTPPVEDDRERHEARVLNAFDGYEPNDIALMTEEELATRDGIDVDSHPAAVDYAKSLIA